MRWNLLAATCLVVLATVVPGNLGQGSRGTGMNRQLSDHIEKEWQTFKVNFSKVYESDKEESFRKNIFVENLESVEAHNRLHDKGLETYTMEINEFSDLTYSEFVDQMTGYEPPDPDDDDNDHFGPTYANNTEVNASLPLPDIIDWRRKGYVTPVRHQRRCKSCWAFSATGSLEGQHFRRTGKLVQLSVQQLLDCSDRNHGCAGGGQPRAFRYVALNGGLAAETSYPYEAVNGTCRFNRSTVEATCQNLVKVPKSELDLQAAVDQIGPISVAIAVTKSFKSYQTGVFNDPSCSGRKLSHAMLVVGYGNTTAGVEYWIVKNSYGPRWGRNGYIFMARNKNNQCGIASDALYPVV